MPTHVGYASAVTPPKAFVADVMLGRLARWLRLLGYDTAYQNTNDDEAVVECARREDRWVLTRDRRLAMRRAIRERSTVIASDDVGEQLRQLEREFHMTLASEPGPSVRCPACNTALLPMPQEEARPHVPPFVAGHHREFVHCATCRRVYWPGTHWSHFIGQLQKIRAAGRGGKAAAQITP
ncbi:Mut7-C RNAse domain-containing protein [Candidatus Nitrospira bockiana]